MYAMALYAVVLTAAETRALVLDNETSCAVSHRSQSHTDRVTIRLGKSRMVEHCRKGRQLAYEIEFFVIYGRVAFVRRQRLSFPKLSAFGDAVPA